MSLKNCDPERHFNRAGEAKSRIQVVEKYSSYVSFQHTFRELTIDTDETRQPSSVPTKRVYHVCIVVSQPQMHHIEIK